MEIVCHYVVRSDTTNVCDMVLTMTLPPFLNIHNIKHLALFGRLGH